MVICIIMAFLLWEFCFCFFQPGPERHRGWLRYIHYKKKLRQLAFQICNYFLGVRRSCWEKAKFFSRKVPSQSTVNTRLWPQCDLTDQNRRIRKLLGRPFRGTPYALDLLNNNCGRAPYFFQTKVLKFPKIVSQVPALYCNCIEEELHCLLHIHTPEYKFDINQ